MCGRYTQHHSTDQVVMRFDVNVVVNETTERYNIAPTQLSAAIINGPNGKTLESLQWGLIPFWAKDPGIGGKLINARAETVAEKPSFRNALTKRRCLVPADGYYEWIQTGKQKRPMFYHMADDSLFAFAGLWEEWRQQDGTSLRSFTIITTTPNELAATAHDRMPVILRPEDESRWLSPDTTNTPEILAMLKPFSAEPMRVYEVSQQVNAPRIDARSLIVPIADDLTEINRSLFN